MDILQPRPERLLLKPVHDKEAWKFYKDAVANFWTAEEVDLTHDDFAALGADEKACLRAVLSFFATADGVVAENLAENFVEDVQVGELRAFYAFQAAIETVHQEVYGDIILTYIPDTQSRQRMFDAQLHDPTIRKLTDWCLRWTQSDTASFAQRLVAFACVEGILFSAPFCVIFYFKQLGVLPGLCKSNEFIARDEAQHMEFACFVYRDRLLPEQKIAEADVHSIVRECVALEEEFVRGALRRLPGMNADSMITYVHFVADVLLQRLGVAPLYNARNPFSWMTTIGVGAKQNFFENRVSEYKRASVTAQLNAPLEGVLNDCQAVEF